MHKHKQVKDMLYDSIRTTLFIQLDLPSIEKEAYNELTTMQEDRRSSFPLFTGLFNKLKEYL